MITSVNEFKLYEAKKKKKTSGKDLVIVDVQKSFTDNYSNEYLIALNKYAEDFSRVFQIWDSTDNKKPDYIFQNQTGVYSKNYGSSLNIEDVDRYFAPQQRDYVRQQLKAIPNDGEMFETVYGDYWIYLGQEKWFLCNKELTQAFKTFIKQNRSIILVGREMQNAISDIYHVMKTLGVKVEYNSEYNYTIDGSQFDKIDESLITESNIKFQEETHNYQHRQYDISMSMYVDDKLVAKADYSLFDGKIAIKMIEAYVKGQGYGKMVMRELAKRYGYENIERQQLTPDGVKMRNILDKEYAFDYKKYIEDQNKHLHPNIIDKIRNKYPMIADFMSAMTLFGYSDAWKKYKDQIIEFEKTNSNIDFNDVSDITKWIKNSATNDNDSTEEVPDFIKEYLNKLL